MIQMQDSAELCKFVQNCVACVDCRLGADYLCPAELHFNLTAAAFVRLSRYHTAH